MIRIQQWHLGAQFSFRVRTRQSSFGTPPLALRYTICDLAVLRFSIFGTGIYCPTAGPSTSLGLRITCEWVVAPAAFVIVMNVLPRGYSLCSYFCDLSLNPTTVEGSALAPSTDETSRSQFDRNHPFPNRIPWWVVPDVFFGKVYDEHLIYRI